MKLRWLRGSGKTSFKRPQSWFCLGFIGSGKSTFLEHVGEKYAEEGASIFDLFGSRDGEGLAWLRNPNTKDKRTLLLKGDNVDVDASVDVKNVEALKVSDVDKYDLIISASPLFLNIDQEFYNAGKITDLLYGRIAWKRLVYLIMREASNFYYSRLKISDSQLEAKAEMTYLIRESRHVGLSLALDSVRFYSIDIDIRSLTSYLVLKAQGLHGLTKDLKFLYSFVDPHLVRKLRPQDFLIITQPGDIGYGTFPFHEWHKREREDILKEVGVKVEYGELLEQPKLKGTYQTVGDKEHVEIIRLHVDEALGMVEIAEKLHRSSRTPHTHIHAHNEAVSRSGFCAACKRAGSKYESLIVERRKI